MPDGGNQDDYRKHKTPYKEHSQDAGLQKTAQDFFPSIAQNLFNHNLSPIKAKSDVNTDKSQVFSKLIERIKNTGGGGVGTSSPQKNTQKRTNLEQLLS